MIKEVICNDNDISEAFDKFFANIIPNLKIISRKNLETTVECETENPVQNAISKFKNHPSIKVMISRTNSSKKISFCPVSHNETLKQIKHFDTKKAIQQNNISTKLFFFEFKITLGDVIP